jgi:hypothetical protein
MLEIILTAQSYHVVSVEKVPCKNSTFFISKSAPFNENKASA